MGCGVCCLKCLLIVFNVLFGLIGVVLLAVGIFVKVGAQDMLMGLLSGVLDSIPDIPGMVNLADASAPTGALNLDFSQLLNTAAVPLIVLGAFMLAVSLVGGIGACCSSKIILIVYAVIVIILFLAQLVIVIMFFTGKLDHIARDQLMGMIRQDYGGIDDFSVNSLLLNYLMVDMACCGVDSYADFDEAVKWDKQRSFTQAGFTVNVNLVTPIACCKFTGTFPDVTPAHESCAYLPTELTSNWHTGCWSRIQTILENNKQMGLGAACGVLIFQALIAVCTIIIAYSLSKEKSNIV